MGFPTPSPAPPLVWGGVFFLLASLAFGAAAPPGPNLYVMDKPGDIARLAADSEVTVNWLSSLTRYYCGGNVKPLSAGWFNGVGPLVQAKPPEVSLCSLIEAAWVTNSGDATIRALRLEKVSGGVVVGSSKPVELMPGHTVAIYHNGTAVVYDQNGKRFPPKKG